MTIRVPSSQRGVSIATQYYVRESVARETKANTEVSTDLLRALAIGASIRRGGGMSSARYLPVLYVILMKTESAHLCL
jgi:hypothetical protein